MPSLALLNIRMEEKMQPSWKFQDRLNSSGVLQEFLTTDSLVCEKDDRVDLQADWRQDTRRRKIQEQLNLASAQSRIQLDLFTSFLVLGDWLTACWEVWGSGSLSTAACQVDTDQFWPLQEQPSRLTCQTDWQTSVATQTHSGKRCGGAHY